MELHSVPEKRWARPAVTVTIIAALILGMLLLSSTAREFAGFWIDDVKTAVSEKLGPDPTRGVPVSNIEIVVSEKNYRVLSEKRREALRMGVLLTEDDDYVDAQIVSADERYDAKIRLKGDWTDHLLGDTWSFRVKLEDDALGGLRRFSLQHPQTRNFLNEWLFHKALAKLGLPALRYQFVGTKLTRLQKKAAPIKLDLGVYALEEAFSTDVIENNTRRAGVIVKVDEAALWEERAVLTKHGLSPEIQTGLVMRAAGSPIDTFRWKKTAKDPNLREQFLVAKDLFGSYLDGTRKISEVFDLDMLAKYNAVVNLMGAEHSLFFHNFRFYYNPISSRLEPIGYDANGGHARDVPKVFPGGTQDAEYMAHYARALRLVGDPRFLEDLWQEHKTEGELYDRLLKAEFDIRLDKKTLIGNQGRIRTFLEPARAFHAYLDDTGADWIKVELAPLTQFPVEIGELSLNGKTVSKSASVTLLPGENKKVVYRLAAGYANAFVDKKTRKVRFNPYTDGSKFSVQYRLVGSETFLGQAIIPWPRINEALLSERMALYKSNMTTVPFVFVDHESKTATLQSGNRELSGNLVIPKGYSLVANEGLELNLVNGASIFSFSPLRFTGSEQRPIKIYSSDGSGGGVLVLNAENESMLRFVYFDGLKAPSGPGLGLTGAVTFFKSDVRIERSRFARADAEDALNVVSSKVVMHDSQFVSSRSDAFDGDFVDAEFQNVAILRSGNDGFDVSGSKVKGIGVSIIEAGDKGVSVGESSDVHWSGGLIGEGEIGFASKDGSTLTVEGTKLHDLAVGFTAYQKKVQYAETRVNASNVGMSSVDEEFLVEHGAVLIKDGEAVATVPSVAEKMYGVEYGAATRR